jgi:hypothetical protein
LFYDKDSEAKIQHLNYIGQKYSKIIIVEQHPFFSKDLHYIQTKKLIVDIGTKFGIDLYWLTADYIKLKSFQDKTSFWPHWYFELRYNANEFNFRGFNWPTVRQFNFSCNNMSNYRSEKIYNYIECFKRHRSDWRISLYDHPHAKISELDISGIPFINQEQVKIWDEEIKHTIKMYEYDLYQHSPQNPFNVLFPGHVDAYCNLVMEHSMEIEILSEKSFKPFVSKQIPVFCAQAGACAALTKLGFDLFYDFIDHNIYDNIVDSANFDKPWIERILVVHELIDKLYTTNFTDFIESLQTKHRLEKNCDYFYSNNIDKLCLEKLQMI